jgi:hypothetical protein
MLFQIPRPFLGLRRRRGAQAPIASSHGPRPPLELRLPQPPAVHAPTAGGAGAVPASCRPDEQTDKEPDMPLARGRAGRRGVLGGPVTCTAAVVGTAAVVKPGHDRRDVRRLRHEDPRDDHGPAIFR